MSFIFVWIGITKMLSTLAKLVKEVHLIVSPPDFSGVHVTRSLVLCVCFVDRCLSFCPFSFGHCVVCPSSIYGFWLPIWFLQILLNLIMKCGLRFCFIWYVCVYVVNSEKGYWWYRPFCIFSYIVTRLKREGKPGRL
jgi:hypothetical protein